MLLLAALSWAQAPPADRALWIPLGFEGRGALEDAIAALWPEGGLALVEGVVPGDAREALVWDGQRVAILHDGQAHVAATSDPQEAILLLRSWLRAAEEALPEPEPPELPSEPALPEPPVPGDGERAEPPIVLGLGTRHTFGGSRALDGLCLSIGAAVDVLELRSVLVWSGPLRPLPDEEEGRTTEDLLSLAPIASLHLPPPEQRPIVLPALVLGGEIRWTVDRRDPEAQGWMLAPTLGGGLDVWTGRRTGLRIVLAARASAEGNPTDVEGAVSLDLLRMP